MKCPWCDGTGDVPDALGHRADSPNYNAVIEHFYRSRARGSKIKLKDVAATMGLNYGVLRKRKMEYDAHGGWGSKGKA